MTSQNFAKDIAGNITTILMSMVILVTKNQRRSVASVIKNTMPKGYVGTAILKQKEQLEEKQLKGVLHAHKVVTLLFTAKGYVVNAGIG